MYSIECCLLLLFVDPWSHTKFRNPKKEEPAIKEESEEGGGGLVGFFFGREKRKFEKKKRREAVPNQPVERYAVIKYLFASTWLRGGTETSGNVGHGIYLSSRCADKPGV